MEILPKLTRFRINGLQISSFYTLNKVLDKETENIFQTPQGTVPLCLNIAKFVSKNTVCIVKGELFPDCVYNILKSFLATNYLALGKTLQE